MVGVIHWVGEQVGWGQKETLELVDLALEEASVWMEVQMKV